MDSMQKVVVITGASQGLGAGLVPAYRSRAPKPASPRGSAQHRPPRTTPATTTEQRRPALITEPVQEGESA